MADTTEIRRMIATATIGDGDQILNILEKVCDKLDEIERKASQAAKDARDAITDGPGIIGRCE